jgi:hypothetical protein
MEIPNLGEIATAWVRVFKGTPEQGARAAERLAICETCPAKVFTPLILSYTCDDCGCPLKGKAFSPLPGGEACPRKKWPN